MSYISVSYGIRAEGKGDNEKNKCIKGQAHTQGSPFIRNLRCVHGLGFNVFPQLCTQI